MKQIMRRLGPHTSILEPGENDRPCIGYIRGASGAVLVDGGNSPAHAETFLSFLTEGERAAVSRILLTHWHWDHIFGAETLGFPVTGNPKLEGQLDVIRELDWSPAGLEKRLENGLLSLFSFQNQTGEIALGGRGSVPALSEVVSRGEWDLGGVRCIYEEIPSPHVDGSYVVFVPEDRILFLGDALWPNMDRPAWTYDLTKVRAMYECLKKYHAEFFVDSHSEPVKRDVLFLWLKKLILLLVSVQEKGMSYEDALAGLPEELRGIDIGLDDAVAAACR